MKTLLHRSIRLHFDRYRRMAQQFCLCIGKLSVTLMEITHSIQWKCSDDLQSLFCLVLTEGLSQRYRALFVNSTLLQVFCVVWIWFGLDLWIIDFIALTYITEAFYQRLSAVSTTLLIDAAVPRTLLKSTNKNFYQYSKKKLTGPETWGVCRVLEYSIKF